MTTASSAGSSPPTSSRSATKSTAVHTGPEGVERAAEPWQAIILDLMLPGMDGFEVLKQIRKTSDVPVLMLTARGDEADRIVGLEIGADDYLPKTFSTRELLARLRAVIRRSALRPGQARRRPGPLAGPLRMSLGARVVTIEDKPLNLTPVEFDLLACLMRARGRVRTREQLLEEIRDRNYEVFDRSIDVHISALAQKTGRRSQGAALHPHRPHRGLSAHRSGPGVTRMRPRFPLSAKILLWFFANLLFIGIAAYAFIEFEFHLGPESLLGGRAGQRVDALADLVNGEIDAEPPAQWSDILARAGNLYGLHLLITTPEGRRVAGEDISSFPGHDHGTDGRHVPWQDIALPDEVLARLYRPRPLQPRGPMRGPPGPDGAGPPPPRDHASLPRLVQAIPQARRRAARPPARPPHDPHLQSQSLLAPAPARCPGPTPGPQPPRRPPPSPSSPFRSPSASAASCSISPRGSPPPRGIVLFSLLFWLPLVRGITRSIREMTGATARVAEGRFDIPVRENRGDELGLLARSINQMAGRLAGFVNGQKRFLGDIAHELCSPLARAQVALGIMEREISAGALADLREEVQQMSSLVNELLSFSKASLAAGRIKLQSVPLARGTGARHRAREPRRRRHPVRPLARICW